MKLLDRYVLRELTTPFCVGVLTFLTILLAEVTYKRAPALIGRDIPLTIILNFLLYSIPRLFVLAMPVGTVLAVSMAMNRLTRDFESTAMRSAHMSFQRICLPLILGGVLLAVCDFILNDWVVPKANVKATRVFHEMILHAPVMRSRANVQFVAPDGRVFSVRRMSADTNTLEGVHIFDRQPDGGVIITTAERARSDGKRWTLLKGRIYAYGPDQHLLGIPTAFDQQPVELDAALQKYWTDERRDFEMSTQELQQKIEVLSQGGKNTRELQVELQMKYAIPFACIVFALIAAPLSHQYARSGSFAGVLIAILLVFLYNGVMSWDRAFGDAGVLPPVVAAWLQNVLFGGLGLWLLFRVK